MDRSEGTTAGGSRRLMELVILARAESEILATQAQLETVVAGLGDRFNQKVEEALDQLAIFPHSGAAYLKSFRRLLVQDFPYGIFYSVDGRRVIVQAVLDLRRDAPSIERELRGV